MTREAFAVRRLHEELREVLAGVHAKRDTRTPAWVLAELQAMCDAVNVIRLERGRPLVTVQEVERVETGALGHTDYASKFALYCAELALEINGAR